MGRTCSYDADEVLEKAGELFRERGFQRSSVQDIVEATGLNRFAIYEKFGGKEGIFYAALDFYIEVRLKQRLLASLRGPDVSLSSLLGVLRKMRNINLDPNQAAGCLIMNASIEMARQNAKVEQVNAKFCEVFREAVVHVLACCEARGELSAGKPIEQRAEYLVTMANAFMVTAHMSRPSADKLLTMVIEDVVGWQRGVARPTLQAEQTEPLN